MTQAATRHSQAVQYIILRGTDWFPDGKEIICMGKRENDGIGYVLIPWSLSTISACISFVKGTCHVNETWITKHKQTLFVH